jgi:adenylate cyclase
VSLLAELQRRSVFKVAAAYLVVGWLVIQVAATLAPQMGLPEWTPRFVSLIVMLGFPVALVIAWVFDATPEGLKVEPAPVGTKRMLAIAALLAAAAIGWYWKGGPVGEGGTGSARSIAVLPFVNMSGDPSNEYFSDGISEEILNVLARTPELSVAARTSSFAFKGKTQDIPGIARELKVRMVLEGSVRKQGERVRITAQLIDAETGFHAWSQTYDRDLKDIFAIQDEIAKAIGNELKVRIGGAGGSNASVSGTTDVAAHDLYLRGLALWQQRTDASLLASIDAFRKALEADPGFAQAWGALSMAYAVIPAYSNRLSNAEAELQSIDAAQRALALDPTLAEAYMAMGNIAGTGVWSGRRRATGVALLQRAIELRPSSATAYQWMGTMQMEMGDPAQGLAALQRAAELDPRSLIVASNLASLFSMLGRDEEAIATCLPTLEYAPDSILCVSVMGMSALMLGDRARARPYYDRWARNVGGGTDRQVAEFFAALEGKADRKAFVRKLRAFPERSWRDANSGNLFGDFDQPLMLMMLGEPGLALDLVERSSKGNFIDITWALMMPTLDPIRCDPRFAAAVDRTGMADHRAPRICAGKRPS